MASTNVFSSKEYSNGVKVVTVQMTCGAGEATFTDFALEERSKRLMQVTIKPGTPGPTDNSDIAITDGITGVNLVATNGTDAVDNAVTNVIAPDNTSNIVIGGLTVAISNNAVNAAVVTVYMVFAHDIKS